MTEPVLLAYFFEPSAIPLGESCAVALESMGHTVERFNSQVEHPANVWFIKYLSRIARFLSHSRVDLAQWVGLDNDTVRNKAFLDAVSSFKPDTVIILRGNSLQHETISALKTDYGVKRVVAWWVKPPEGLDQILNERSWFDDYYCIHQNWAHGHQLQYLNALAVYQTIYHPLPGIKKQFDVSFVGGCVPRRLEAIKALQDVSVNIWGPGWRKPKNGWHPKIWQMIRGSNVWGEPLNHVYNTSKIVLNITSWRGQQASGQNMRIFDVPATGAFLLTDYSDELNEFFELGREIETWTSHDELHDKVKFYLANDDARERIARAGYERIQKVETFADKMSRILHK